MRHLILILLCLPITVGGFAQHRTRVWTEKERQFLLSGLETTRRELLKEVQGLSEAQMHFKPDSSQWSVAEVVEHLGVWEEILQWDLFTNQYTPEQPELATAVQRKDSIMLAYATDPAKGVSPTVALPLGRFQTRDDLTQYFNSFRDEVIKLVRASTADFRVHFIYRPKDWGDWAVRDLHQYTVVYIAHTTRHTNQIRRVKAHPNFPKQ